MKIAHDLGCTSSDGTFLAWGPDGNLLRMRAWYTREGLTASRPTSLKRRDS